MIGTSPSIGTGAVVIDLRPGQWLWLDRPYNTADPAPVVLGPLHVGDGRQYVYWQVERENELDGVRHVGWGDAQNVGLVGRSRLARCFKTVTDACDALSWYGTPGVTYRLARFDKTPLLTAKRRKAGWDVRPWE